MLAHQTTNIVYELNANCKSIYIHVGEPILSFYLNNYFFLHIWTCLAVLNWKTMSISLICSHQWQAPHPSLEFVLLYLLIYYIVLQCNFSLMKLLVELFCTCTCIVFCNPNSNEWKFICTLRNLNLFHQLSHSVHRFSIIWDL